MFGGKAETIHRTVELRDATTARAKIDMSAGKLRLHGGARALMEGEFTVSKGMEPSVDYEVDGGRGSLEIVQPPIPKALRLPKNEWDVRLNGDTPLDLQIDHSAGESTIDASLLTLTSLEMDHSAGRSYIDIDGDQRQLSWVDVDVAAGDCTLRLTGRYTSLRDLRVESAAGRVSLDVSGTWESDLDARIEAATGQITVRLPKGTSAVVEAETTIGQVKATGLMRDHGRFRHDVPNSAATLRIRVETSVGQIILEVAE